MRMRFVVILCFGLAGCAAGSATEEARNEHDLGALNDAGLALASQARTDANNIHEIARRVAAASP